MGRKRNVSLSNELHVIMDSIRGVHSLTRQWIESFGHDPLLPNQVAALLSVLIERFRLVDRVVRGTVDPHLIWSLENDADLCPGDPSEEDVVLTAWSERKLARHHRTQWRRVKARLAKKSSARDTRDRGEDNSP
jgi:hypothetical protein